MEYRRKYSGKTALAFLKAISTAFMVGTVFISTAQANEALTARGLIVAKRQATLSSNVAAPIAEVFAELGDRVEKGRPLLRFDCSILEAAKAQVDAQLLGATANLKAKQRLRNLKSSSQLDVDLAKSEAATLAAELDSVNAKLSYCDVRAPYSGRIARRHVDAHETISQNEPLFDIVGYDLRIHVIAPSIWMRWVKPGEAFEIEIEEIGTRYAAKVSVIGARVDHASQLVELYGNFDSEHPELLPGMSGQVVFPSQASQ